MIRICPSCKHVNKSEEADRDVCYTNNLKLIRCVCGACNRPFIITIRKGFKEWLRKLINAIFAVRL